MSKKILIVGAGFAGAVYARTLAEAGFNVTIIDRRSHIGGNAYDEVDPKTGIRFHRYGPHLFHTSSRKVVEWISQFGSWVPYRHRVRARMADGSYLPLPVNLDTINGVFHVNLENEEQVGAFLSSKAVPLDKINNAGDWLRSKIGNELTDLFFARYTQKMWGISLNDMSSSVVKRLPIRMSREDGYFTDEWQRMPLEGYTRVFEEILSHDRITVYLSRAYESGLESEYVWCFNSMAIDEYFRSKFGPLPYRSIRFHHQLRARDAAIDWAVTNFTDTEKFTRETYWHVLPPQPTKAPDTILVTMEEPCDYQDNNFERYYPVKTADDKYSAIYEQYRTEAQSLKNMSFIGRCGTYQYLDMDQVINQSLSGAINWLKAHAD